MASKNTALIKLVADNHDLTKKLADSERRVKGLEKAVARSSKQSKGAFSPLAESVLKQMGPLGKLTRRLHVVAGDVKKVGQESKVSTGKLGGVAEKFGGIGKSIGGMAGPLAAAGAAIGGLAVAFDFTKDAIGKLRKLAGETRKLTRETGMNAESASAYIAIGDRMGVSTEKLSRSFGIFSKNLAGGTKKFEQAMSDLGVADEVLNSGNMDKILMSIADGFKAMPDGVDKTAISMQVFGRGGKDLIPILNKGSDGLSDLKKEMAALGLTIDEKTMKQSVELGKAQKTLNQVFDGLQITLATKVIPYLSKAAVKFKDFIVQFRTGKGTGGDIGRVFGKVGAVFGFVASKFGAIKRAMAIQFPFITNTVKAIRLVFSDGFGKAARSVGKAITGIVSTISKFVSNGASAAARFARGIFRSLTGGVRGLPNTVGRVMGSIVSSIGRRVSAVFNVGVRFGRAIVRGVRGAVGGLWNAVKGPLQRAINGVIGGINWIIGKANNLIGKIPGPLRPDKIGKLPQVRLARGAVVTRPTMALIGEAGPEAVVPLSPGKRGRAAAVMSQAGLSGAQMTFNITNNGNQLDERVLASRLAWQLQARGI